MAAAGGKPPYRYQWQVSSGNDIWTDLEGETGDTLKLTGATLVMNGNLYRCVIRDFNDTSVISNPALLTVTRPVPRTGDDAKPVLWMLLMVLGAAGWIMIWKRRNASRSEQKEKNRM